MAVMQSGATEAYLAPNTRGMGSAGAPVAPADSQSSQDEDEDEDGTKKRHINNHA